MSVDSAPCLTAWAESLGGISYPLLSDFWPHGAVAKAWGVLRTEGYAERAIFLVDCDGVIRYIDVHAIDDAPDPAVLIREIEALEPVAAHPGVSVSPGVPGEAIASPDEPGALYVYCTPWCPDCMRARTWLHANGIPYVEVDVSVDTSARERAAALNEGRLHTPTFECRGQVVVDFDEARVRDIIG